jgi:hypothetical protein
MQDSTAVTTGMVMIKRGLILGDVLLAQRADIALPA